MCGELITADREKKRKGIYAAAATGQRRADPGAADPSTQPDPSLRVAVAGVTVLGLLLRQPSQCLHSRWLPAPLRLTHHRRNRTLRTRAGPCLLLTTSARGPPL